MKRWLMGMAVLCAASSAFGQVLADKVPADAAVYVGWRGITNPEPGYTGSNFEAIMQESQFLSFVDDTLPAIGKQVGMKNPQYAEAAAAGASIARQLIRHPTAFYLSVAKDITPRAGLLCQAGTDADELKKAFDLIVAQLPPDAQAAATVNDGVVSLQVNANTADPTQDNLAAVPAFKSAMAQVAADGSLVAYANIDVIRNTGANALGKYAADYSDMVDKFLTSSGLKDTHGLAFSESFKDKNAQTEFFLDAPSPRKGLLALGDAKPLDADFFKRVPAHATLASQFSLDPETVLTTIRQITQDTYPPAADMMDKGLGIATLSVGKNIETDLLQSLGDQWLFYTAPQIGGSSITGAVVVNKLTNVLKAKQSVGALWIFLSNTGQTATHNQPFTLAAHTAKFGNTTVNYFGLPVFAPAWTIKDGNLYIGLFPQTVAAAANYQGDTLADSDAYKTAAGPVVKPETSAISYTDVPAMMGDGYTSLLLLSRTFFGAGDMFLAPSPEPIVPPLTVLGSHAASTGAAFWADAAGLHSRMVESFPGATSIANMSFGNIFASNIPMAASSMSVLLPSLNRARESANRIKSASNLRQIGLANILYANEHNQQLAPDLKSLLQNEDITAAVFLNPRTAHALPPVPNGQKPADVYADWVNDNSDYGYIGAGLKTDAPADEVIAYEKPDGITDGINILYADGHVEFSEYPTVAGIFAKHNQPVPDGMP